MDNLKIFVIRDDPQKNHATRRAVIVARHSTNALSFFGQQYEAVIEEEFEVSELQEGVILDQILSCDDDDEEGVILDQILSCDDDDEED